MVFQKDFWLFNIKTDSNTLQNKQWTMKLKAADQSQLMDCLFDQFFIENQDVSTAPMAM